MNRVLRALLVTCVLLALALGFLFYRQVPRSQKPFKDAAKADAFEMTEGTQTVKLVLSGSWTVQMQGGNVPADLTKANRVPSDLATVEVEDQISDRSDRGAEFQVDASSGIHVKTYKGATLLAEGIFGKQAPDFMHIYFAFPNKAGVFLAKGLIRGELEPISQDAWRGREITQLAEAEIQSLAVSSGKQTYTLARSSDNWTVDGETVDPAKVYALLGVISHLRADGFTDFTQSAGVSAAALTITSTHATVTMHIDAIDPARKQAPVFVDGAHGGFWLAEDKVKQLLFKPGDFPLKKEVAGIPPPPAANGAPSATAAGAVPLPVKPK